MKDSFDPYADRYSKIIAEGARASGETYEYMVELRTGLFGKATAEALTPVPGPAILDFGCGTGYTVEQLAKRFPKAQLFGFDTSRESIVQAASRGIHRATFTHGDEYPLPYKDASFDAIYSNGTFHHIPPPERAQWMKELARILKRKGLLVVFENNPLNPLMMQAMRRTPFDRDADPIRAGKLAAIMKGVGLEPGNPYYYFFFPRRLKWLRFSEPLLQFMPFGAQYFLKARKS